MNAVAVRGRRRAVRGGPDERVCELDALANREQPGVHRGVDGRHVDLEGLGGGVQQDGIAERLRGRGEDEELRIGREPVEAPHVALFDLPGHMIALRQTEPAGELRGCPRAGKLEQGKWVAVALGDDLVADGRIQRADQIFEQERPRIVLAQRADRQLGQPGQNAVADARPGSAHERDPLGEEPTSDEAEDLQGRLIEPLRVFHEADERLLFGDLGEERQRGEPDEEPVGRLPLAQCEDRRQRVALGAGSRSR